MAREDDVMQCQIFGHEPGKGGRCEVCGAPAKREEDRPRRFLGPQDGWAHGWMLR